METVEFANDLIKVSLVPSFGGKITSIQSSVSGREWIWTNPYLPRVKANYGDSYVERHDTGGIDECVPTVDACVCSTEPWDGLALPDHGEIYHQTWEQTDRRSDSITLAALGVRMPYRFQRRLILPPGQAPLRLEYRMENLSPYPLPFTWCIHPILNIEPDMEIELPTGTPVRVAFADGDTTLQAGTSFDWPMADAQTDLSHIPDPEQKSFVTKLFAAPLGEGWAGLRAGDETLRFGFNTGAISCVAMWLNYGAWTGAGTPNYFNAVIEPSIGDADSLNESIERGTSCWLAPGESKDWQLDINLSLNTTNK